MRRLDRRALGRQLQRLGLGRRALLRQPFGAPRQLGAALAQLARLSHEIHALTRDPHLLEAQRLEPIPLAAEGDAMTLERSVEVTRHDPPLGRESFRLAERGARGLALGDDRVETPGGHPNFLVQPHRLLAELAHLYAHLLAAFEQALELALHLLHALAQVGEGMIAGLDDLALLRLACGERGDARPLHLLRLAQRRKLGGQLRGLSGQRRVVGGHEAQRELTPLAL